MRTKHDLPLHNLFLLIHDLRLRKLFLLDLTFQLLNDLRSCFLECADLMSAVPLSEDTLRADLPSSTIKAVVKQRFFVFHTLALCRTWLRRNWWHRSLSIGSNWNILLLSFLFHLTHSSFETLNRILIEHCLG